MVRATLGQVQLSDLPKNIGALSSDLPTIAAAVNRASQQLINCGGETGWWGGWMKVVFLVSRAFPYITLPRGFARAINMDVCRFPIRIQNEFYEFLEAGIGLQGFKNCGDWGGTLEGYERGVWSTMVDLNPVNQLLRVYITDPRDVGARILFSSAIDQNGSPIYSQDGNNSVNGFFLKFSQPFTTSTFQVSGFGGIQKDQTYGDVLLYQVDATTGTQVLLSRFAPDELLPAYRRYYINRMPCHCGPVLTPTSPCLTTFTPNTNQAAVTAMVKLEYIPVSRATDFLIIGNIPALIEECKAIRYADMDSKDAPLMEQKSHRRAIKLLQDEMRHYLGELQPAVNFAPFGNARLARPMCAVSKG